MINRYIYAVTRELPEKSRKEIDSELRSLIGDMVDGMEGGLSEKEKINQVLADLGDPKELANRYRGKDRYLIGPHYFEKYLLVMKIVILSVFLGISIAWGLGIISSNQTMAEIIATYISALLSATLQGAAWVTGIFALLEYKDVFLDRDVEPEPWEPSQLPVLAEKKAFISRGESIFAIIMATIFLQLFLFFPEIIGIYYKAGGNEWKLIQVFNIDNIILFRITIFLIFAINILIELIKIIKGKWTIKIAVIITTLNLISAALFIHTFSNMAIWNRTMVEKIDQYIPISFERMILFTLAIIITISIGESVSGLYKGIKYGDAQ